MKNTWRILAAVAALSLAACTDDDEDGGGGTGGGSCTGTFTGAVTGSVGSCTVTATKLDTNGELLYTIRVEPAVGSGTVKSVDDIIITLSSKNDPAKGSFTGTAIREATGSVYSTDQDKQYDLQLGFGADLGSASLTIDSVPTGKDEGADTLYEGFGGRAQIKYDASPIQDYTGSVELALTFKP